MLNFQPFCRCINQKDSFERSHQVGLMGPIYRKATRVLVWLGLPPAPPKEFGDYFEPGVKLAALREWQQRLSIEDDPPPSWKQWWKDKASELRKTRAENKERLAFDLLERAANDSTTFLPSAGKWREKFVYDPSFTEHWRQLRSLLYDVDYWTRLWIIQEVGLGISLLILLGKHVCDWDNFRIVRQTLSRYHVDTGLGDPGGCLESIRDILGSFAAQLDAHKEDRSDGFTLEALLESCSLPGTAYCSERRDKVYGLLGLAVDVDIGAIPIDYSRSISEIYMDCIKFKVDQQLLEGPQNLVRFSHLLQQALISPLSSTDGTEEIKIFQDKERSKINTDSFRIIGYEAGSIRTINLGHGLSNTETQTRIQDKDPTSSIVLPPTGRGLTEKQWKQTFPEIWKFEHKTHDFPDTRNKVRFFEKISNSEGSLKAFIGVTSTKVQDSDILVTFEGCDVAVVVRQDNLGCKIISRAIVAEEIKPITPPSTKSVLAGGLYSKIADTKSSLTRPVLSWPLSKPSSPEVEFHIDLWTLQSLTAPLKKRTATPSCFNGNQKGKKKPSG